MSQKIVQKRRLQILEKHLEIDADQEVRDADQEVQDADQEVQDARGLEVLHSMLKKI